MELIENLSNCLVGDLRKNRKELCHKKSDDEGNCLNKYLLN